MVEGSKWSTVLTQAAIILLTKDMLKSWAQRNRFKSNPRPSLWNKTDRYLCYVQKCENVGLVVFRYSRGKIDVTHISQFKFSRKQMRQKILHSPFTTCPCTYIALCFLCECSWMNDTPSVKIFLLMTSNTELIGNINKCNRHPLKQNKGINCAKTSWTKP